MVSQTFEKRHLNIGLIAVAHTTGTGILAENFKTRTAVFPNTISEKLSDTVIDQAMKLSAEERQMLVISYVSKAKEVWLVQGSEGFVMLEDDGAVRLPIFPHRDLANAFVTSNGLDGMCVSTPLNEFVSTWLPGLETNGVELVMFPTQSDVENLVMTAPELSEELGSELNDQPSEDKTPELGDDESK